MMFLKRGQCLIPWKEQDAHGCLARCKTFLSLDRRTQSGGLRGGGGGVPFEEGLRTATLCLI